jgi:hypothetical protein
MRRGQHEVKLRFLNPSPHRNGVAFETQPNCLASKRRRWVGHSGEWFACSDNAPA